MATALMMVGSMFLSENGNATFMTFSPTHPPTYVVFLEDIYIHPSLTSAHGKVAMGSANLETVQKTVPPASVNAGRGGGGAHAGIKPM